MATSRGRTDVKRFIQQLPGELERKVLRGAARAAATFIADDAKERSISPEVDEAIKVTVRSGDGHVVAKIQVNMGGYNLPLWLEYGTDAHFISVDQSQREGMSVGRINELHKAGTLVIKGHFVGDTVHHPGARPHPFLRPALDNNEDAAMAVAQSYINARITPGGIVGTEETVADA